MTDAAAENRAHLEALNREDATCPECGAETWVLEHHDETIRYEEQAREVTVTNLACGHEVVTRR